VAGSFSKTSSQWVPGSGLVTTTRRWPVGFTIWSDGVFMDEAADNLLTAGAYVKRSVC
jgi:hypothetical protein